jgi:hypothetical protein
VGWVRRTTCSGGRRKHTHAYADFVGVIAAAGREDLLAALHGNGGPEVRPPAGTQHATWRMPMQHATRHAATQHGQYNLQNSTGNAPLQAVKLLL